MLDEIRSSINPRRGTAVDVFDEPLYTSLEGAE